MFPPVALSVEVERRRCASPARDPHAVVEVWARAVHVRVVLGLDQRFLAGWAAPSLLEQCYAAVLSTLSSVASSSSSSSPFAAEQSTSFALALSSVASSLLATFALAVRATTNDDQLDYKK
jgi:hypothetical protein